MLPLIVVDNPKRWPLKNPGALVVSARAYLTEREFSILGRAHVFNLCRSYRYQSMGYYVSLLAMARGHTPLPSITTIQDLKSLGMLRLASDELHELLQRGLRTLQSDTFTLSVYFGRNLARRYDLLSTRLFQLFQVPFLRAEFVRDDGGWRIRTVRAIGASEIPENHHDFVHATAREYFSAERRPLRRRAATIYDLAILVDPTEPLPPSNERALRRLTDAARRRRVGVELIERADIGRLAEFDALFIRATTAVNHFTYRFARRAMAEGLIVIDDPDSIAKCANKVYLAELLEHHDVPRPATLIVHRDNRARVSATVGLPCVLKQPDSAFSRGVTRADTEEALQAALDKLLDESDLVIAQTFVPTPFDWRVVVLDREPLVVCRYHMARRHWQILRQKGDGRIESGAVDTVPLDDVPRVVLRIALRAARLIGDGLYGVDLKQVDRQVFVVEVNDNPNLDAGYEDKLLKHALYDRLVDVFIRRIEQRKRAPERG